MEIVHVTPHPLKSKFESFGIRQWQIARLLGCSQSLVSLILTGIKPPTEELEQKLQKISKELKEEANA